MGILDSSPVPRRTMVLFFIVDTAGYMGNGFLMAINSAMHESLQLKEISDEDAEIKIAVLQFSNGCEWMYNKPMTISDFVWKDLEAGGLSDLGSACVELNSKLSRSALMHSATGSFAPGIILLTDGEPTDDYDRGLGILKENKWFKHATKIAIAIGSDSNKDALKAFTGSIESVIEANNDTLKKILKIVASNVCIHFGAETGGGGRSRQDRVVEAIRAGIGE